MNETATFCSCGGRCGRHIVVVTMHSAGWMAGCHCGAGFKMPVGLYGDGAVVTAGRLFRQHVAQIEGLDAGLRERPAGTEPP